MQSTWHSLLWKEWREYRWKLAALTAGLLLPYVGLLLWTREGRLETLQELTMSIVCVYGIIAPMFLGMSVAAKENGEGTSPFLNSLPSPKWKAGFAKIIVASITATLPIVVVVAVGVLFGRFGNFWLGDIGLPISVHISLDLGMAQYFYGWFFHFLMVAIFSTLSILRWVAAFGVNRSDEVRAAAIGFLGAALVWFGLGLLFYLSRRGYLPVPEKILAAIGSAAPGGPLFWQSLEPSGSRIPDFDRSWPIVSFIGHVLVGTCCVARFGRVRQREGKSDQLQGPHRNLSVEKPPYKTQLVAIAWKQVYETGPLAILALTASLAMAGLGKYLNDDQWRDFRELFLSISACMTFLVALVAGIALYLDDLKPGLADFWRSRPIPVGLWFGVKYCVGLLVLATILGVPMILTAFGYLGSVEHLRDRQVLSVTILVFGWLFVVVYSLAMTAQCLLRQPLYAAIASVLAIWLGASAFEWAFGYPYWTVTAVAMLQSLAAVVVLGWLAVRNDWGWKR